MSVSSPRWESFNKYYEKLLVIFVGLEDLERAAQGLVYGQKTPTVVELSTVISRWENRH